MEDGRRRQLAEEVLDEDEDFDLEREADRWLIWGVVAFALFLVIPPLLALFPSRRGRPRRR